MEEQYVRVTISGPVLATLILAGWLELQGAPGAQATEEPKERGTMDAYTETAEYWLELPCSLVYDIAAAPGVGRGSLGRFGSSRASSNGVSIPT